MHKPSEGRKKGRKEGRTEEGEGECSSSTVTRPLSLRRRLKTTRLKRTEESKVSRSVSQSVSLTSTYLGTTAKRGRTEGRKEGRPVGEATRTVKKEGAFFEL